MGKNVWVGPHDKGWAVKSEGAGRPAKVCETQKQAIQEGRDMAKGRGSELLIQGRDGRIRDRDSHGHDPCPPKDKK